MRLPSLTKAFNQAVVAAVLLFCVAGPTMASESPAVRAAIEGRADDYRRQDPGVPVWPSTCDCISLDFGFKDASGARPMRFSFGDAANYYGKDASSDKRRARLTAKGPRKEFAEEEVTEQAE